MTYCTDTACPVLRHCRRAVPVGMAPQLITVFARSPRGWSGCPAFDANPGTPTPTYLAEFVAQSAVLAEIDGI